MKNGKNPIGRPRKTLRDLPTNWKSITLELGRDGMFDVNLRVELGITKETFYSLLKNEPEFQETVNEFRELSHDWWSRIPLQGFKTGKSKELNSNLYSLVLRNRFKEDWSAVNNVDITSGGEKLESTKKIEIEIIKNLKDNDTE